MGKFAISQSVTTEFVEAELGESLLTSEEEKILLGLVEKDQSEEIKASEAK